MKPHQEIVGVIFFKNLFNKKERNQMFFSFFIFE